MLLHSCSATSIVATVPRTDRSFRLRKPPTKFPPLEVLGGFPPPLPLTVFSSQEFRGRLGGTKKADHREGDPFFVEHRRFELLTPTLPVLCATNCANAPNSGYIITSFPLCKALFSGIKTNPQSGGSVRLFSDSPSLSRRAATTSRSASLPSQVTRISSCSSGCTSSIRV